MSSPITKPLLSTYLALTTAIVLWGVAFVAVKIALETLSTIDLIFIRFALSALVFLAVFLFRGIPVFTRREHVKLLCLALFEPGLYFFFETLGLNYIGAAKASLIVACVPLAVLILAGLILKERVRVRGVIGILVSLIGVAMLVVGEAGFAFSMQGSFLGDLCMFAAVISAASYMILARHLGDRHSAFEITSMQIIYAALLYLPVFLWTDSQLQWQAIGNTTFLSLGFLVFVTIISFLCYNLALTRIPASHAAVAVNGIPVVTAMAAWMVLGEMLTPVQIAGGALVLTAVVVTNLKSPDGSQTEADQGMEMAGSG